jgi:hypothetical protein
LSLFQMRAKPRRFTLKLLRDNALVRLLNGGHVIVIAMAIVRSPDVEKHM